MSALGTGDFYFGLVDTGNRLAGPTRPPGLRTKFDFFVPLSHTLSHTKFEFDKAYEKRDDEVRDKVGDKVSPEHRTLECWNTFDKVRDKVGDKPGRMGRF